MTRDELILAAFSSVLINQRFMSDEHARAGQCMSSATVALGTLEAVNAMEAAIEKEKQVEH